MRLKISFSYLYSIALALVVLIITILWIDTTNYRFLGVPLILCSVNTVYRCRHTKKMLLLFSIIAYINICVAVLDMFLMGAMSNYYQHALRFSSAGLTYAKMYLSMASLMDLFITDRFIERCCHSDIVERDNRYNPIISICAMVISLIITLTGFKGSGSGIYVSNQNAFYEYVILFIVVGFTYAGNNKSLKVLLVATGGLYTIQGLIGGDRSSAFMMVLVLYMVLFIKKIKIMKAVGYSICGIILANTVSVLRHASLNIHELWQVLISKGVLFFFSDTVSASFYTGVTIVEYANGNNDRFGSFLIWIKELFIGGSSKTNITRLASAQNYNGGGGMYPSYFYFFGGIIGVIISTAILMYLLKRFMSVDSKIHQLYTTTIVALVFRWYLYTPNSLYRTIFVNFSVIVIFCFIFDAIIRKKFNKFESNT